MATKMGRSFETTPVELKEAIDSTHKGGQEDSSSHEVLEDHLATRRYRACRTWAEAQKHVPPYSVLGEAVGA